MNSVFPAITKINATEAHMFEHYMIQVCPNYCKMSNECRVEKFFLKMNCVFFQKEGGMGP